MTAALIIGLILAPFAVIGLVNGFRIIEESKPLVRQDEPRPTDLGAQASVLAADGAARGSSGLTDWEAQGWLAR